MSGKTKAREDFLSWDDTFMLMADLIAQRSKDPSTQTGAVIVNQNNIVLGMGYNGFPRNTKEGDFPWDRDGGYEKEEFLKTKYPYVVHAEANAIYNASKSIEGAKMYCHLFPCNECAKAIIQKGIKELIYQEDKYSNIDIFQASRKLFEAAGVKVREYVPSKKLKIE